MKNENGTIRAGTVIFRQGVYESWFYDIAYGKVGIYTDYGTENEKLLTELTAGQTFGEMGMIECYPRSATAVALEDTGLVKIDADTFRGYFEDKPEKLIAIMQQMSRRIRELTVDYLEACKALSETVDNETNDSRKSTLKNKLKKYLDAYTEAIAYAAKYDIDYWHHGLTL